MAPVQLATASVGVEQYCHLVGGDWNHGIIGKIIGKIYGKQ